MKIGILTFHRAYNYGAILQAFALQKKLNQMGCDSEIIDYLSDAKKKKNALFHFQKGLGLKGNASKFAKDFYRLGKNRNFDEFMKEQMKISSKSFSNYDEMVRMDQTGAYDNYIVGSDQVWNIKNNNRDKTFLLSFVSDDRKKCSYAASVGHSEFNDDETALYANELKKYRVLAVREQSAIRDYNFFEGLDVRIVLDPTLLLTKVDYEKIASPRIINKKYAFIYTIAEEKELRKFAKKFCKEKGIELIDSKRSAELFRHSNPRDFLSFICNADYVFTNSFHGTAFSIILQKKFAIELDNGKNVNTRSRDIMEALGLLNRDINSKQFDMDNDINYSEVEERLVDLRKASLAVLSNITKENC